MCIYSAAGTYQLISLSFLPPPAPIHCLWTRQLLSHSVHTHHDPHFTLPQNYQDLGKVGVSSEGTPLVVIRDLATGRRVISASHVPDYLGRDDLMGHGSGGRDGGHGGGGGGGNCGALWKKDADEKRMCHRLRVCFVSPWVYMCLCRVCLFVCVTACACWCVYVSRLIVL